MNIKVNSCVDCPFCRAYNVPLLDKSESPFMRSAVHKVYECNLQENSPVADDVSHLFSVCPLRDNDFKVSLIQPNKVDKITETYSSTGVITSVTVEKVDIVYPVLEMPSQSDQPNHYSVDVDASGAVTSVKIDSSPPWEYVDVRDAAGVAAANLNHVAFLKTIDDIELIYCHKMAMMFNRSGLSYVNAELSRRGINVDIQ